MMSNAAITTMDLHIGEVVNYMDYLEHTQRPNYKIVIPSLNRPEELCLTTLALLRSHGISLSNVGVFITPTVLAEHQTPEWSRYLAALRRHDMLEVHLLPGAKGLDQQMRKAMEWVGEGYMITMSDTVTDILVRHTRRRSGRQFLAPMTKGCLLPLIHHARDLMIAGAFTAWSVNPMHNAGRMSSKNLISRKLGLLDGNFSGILLPPNWNRLRVEKGHGLIYDVEWSASLWSRGYRFVRYMNMCADHKYRRIGGQESVFTNPAVRRAKENTMLKRVSTRFPKLLTWKLKNSASLKTMQYRFFPMGLQPLRMMSRMSGGARRGKIQLASSALTNATWMKGCSQCRSSMSSSGV
jgi:hypothetical protein